MTPARITSFLVKVASRCNLDCDYCYVYHHADQSWRTMPKLLSADDRASFARQLGDYAKQANLTHCAVVFHGGEPLLAGAGSLAAFATEIRAATTAKVDVGLQTNGLLLDDAALDHLEAADIGVSLSLDGPREAQDKHRTTRKGRSSFDKVLAALERLKKRPKLFAGVIAVIDASTSPEELFAFFDEHQPPKLDFLLPDAHRQRPPPGRELDPSLYERWLIRAFDLWLDHYPHLPVRTFEALLDAVSGLPSRTDAFGFGDVSLISIETDGSYHDLDVLKVTHDGATRLGGSVRDTPIADVAASAQIAAHRAHLSKAGLCKQCQACPIVEICGGGSLPHRYDSDGFSHPTIYCGEMLALVEHARKRLKELLSASSNFRSPTLSPNFDPASFDLAENAPEIMEELCADAETAAHDALLATLHGLRTTHPDLAATIDAFDAMPIVAQKELAVEPGTIAWRQTLDAQQADYGLQSVDGGAIHAEPAYLQDLIAQAAGDGTGFRTGLADPWLRLPFGDAIYFEDEETAAMARPLVEEALQIIERWRPAMAREMRLACRAVQFVRDPLAHPDKIVSFSDNSVPGALYVSVMQSEDLIDAYDLADSLLHEHRHQKLYLLERRAPTVEPTATMVASPWREDPRPPSGLLHAVFVFVELRRFWVHVRDEGPVRLHNRAINQLRDTEDNLRAAFATLDACPLTSVGRDLVAALKASAECELA